MPAEDDAEADGEEEGEGEDEEDGEEAGRELVSDNVFICSLLAAPLQFN